MPDIILLEIIQPLDMPIVFVYASSCSDNMSTDPSEDSDKTDPNAAIASQPVAGKTGTTSDNYDMWFAGFTPQYLKGYDLPGFVGEETLVITISH